MCDIMRISTSFGCIVVEKTGVKNSYPGLLVSFEKDGEKTLVASIEHDTLNNKVLACLYQEGHTPMYNEDEPIFVERYDNKFL